MHSIYYITLVYAIMPLSFEAIRARSYPEEVKVITIIKI